MPLENDKEPVVEYFILACYVGKPRRKLQWYKPANSEVPLVCVAGKALLLSRRNRSMRLYKLDEKLKLGLRQDNGAVTPDHPKLVQFTKKQIALVREGTENEGSHWLHAPPAGLESQQWHPVSKK